MKTKTCSIRISQSTISEYASHADITRLHDTQNPKLYFTYHKNRTRGTWSLVYHDKSRKTVWVSIGHYPEINTKQARELAANGYVQSRKSENKINIQAAANIESPDNISALLTYYDKRFSQDKTKSDSRKKSIHTAITKHIIPRIGNFQARSLSRAMIEIHLCGYLVDTLAPTSAQKALGTLKQALSFFHRVGMIDVNPMAGISVSEYISAPSTVNTTDLKAHHLPAVFKALHQMRFSSWSLLAFLFLSLGRVGELVQCRWSHIDWDRRTLYIPASNTKNGYEHTIYLSNVLITVLKQIKTHQRANGKRSVFIFPSQKSKRHHITPKSASEKISRLFKGKYTAHDIRKLGRTWATENNIDYLIGEFMLNHRMTKLDRTYIHTYAASKCRDAFSEWASFLESQGLL